MGWEKHGTIEPFSYLEDGLPGLVSVVRISPIYKPFVYCRPFGRGPTTPI